MSSSTESRLDALAGLESAKKVVRKIASGESGIHAVLLYGAKGSGKTELAMALTEAWMCLNSSDSGACGVCQACKTLAKGTNPDVMAIHPQPPSNIIRLAFISPRTNPQKDDPVSLREYLRTQPLMSRRKVAFIHDAHRMNNDASDALLKTLEEPPSYAQLVLTTDSVGGIKSTILSRSLSLACELPTLEAIRRQDPTLTDDDIRLAEGAPGRLKVLAEHPTEYRRVSTFAKGLRSRRAGEALKASEEFRSIADGIEKATDCGARVANAEALDMLAAYLAREQGVNPRWAQLVIEAHRRIVGNGQSGLVFDALFTRMLYRNR